MFLFTIKLSTNLAALPVPSSGEQLHLTGVGRDALYLENIVFHRKRAQLQLG